MKPPVRRCARRNAVFRRPIARLGVTCQAGDVKHVFLCGNPLMIEGMEKMLLGKGFKIHNRRDPGNIFVEKFWAD